MGETANTGDDATPNPSPRSDPGWWAIALIVLFAGGILIAIGMDLKAITRLSEPAYARGLITWLVILTTIGIAFILIYQAFNSASQSDEGFKRGREVFAGLLGMTGTIIGFYFGSAEKADAILHVSEPVQEGQVLRAYVSGGKAPYRYIVDSTDKTLIKSSEKSATSDNGWIKYELAVLPTKMASITIMVTDSRNFGGVVKLEVSPASKLDDVSGKGLLPPASPVGSSNQAVPSSPKPNGNEVTPNSSSGVKR